MNSFNRCLKYINFWRKLFCYPHFDPSEHLIGNIWTGLPVAGLFKAQWPPPSPSWAVVLSLERQRAIDTLAQQGRAWVPGEIPGSRCPTVPGLGHQRWVGCCGLYRLSPRGCYRAELERPNAQHSVPSSSSAALLASIQGLACKANFNKPTDSFHLGPGALCLNQGSPGFRPETESGGGAVIQTYVDFQDPSNTLVITAKDILSSSEIWAV